ncbi:PREDICTED: helicase protein MOM1-like [Nicotiana attenuata]|uniref:helicase protein MOM1-like n=1 Tax=Nicotiana attenuata TaxID=49451 RepID=UPI0009052E20|nr:PREDICTED: helicase protein MOM1-like [Nicotiana attenuata]
MFQVLLSPYDAIVQDLEMLQPISWGAVIIDQCQGYAMSMLLSQIKVLVSDMRLLIFRQLEGRCDRGFNHSNVLSLLDPEYDKANNDLSDTDPNIDLTEFKERLKRFVAYECNSSTSKFIEYWVPVKLSNEQIEQYCDCLSSNSALLCSRWKNDSPNSLHNILVSTRKCCDHPYLEDQSLRDIVLEGIPVDQHFDAEIKLSGKLEFLYS